MYRKVFNEHSNLSFGRYVLYIQTYHNRCSSSISVSPLTSVCVCVCLSLSLSPYSSSHLPPSPTSGPFFPHIVSPFPFYFMWSSHRPKSDTCKECDSYKVQTDAEQDGATLAQLKGEWELHLCKAEHIHHQLKEDTGLSKPDPNVMLVTFDLQHSLPTPVLTTNIFFINANSGLIILGCTTAGQARGTCTSGMRAQPHEG